MFWIRKPQIFNSCIEPIAVLDNKAKKEFETMINILKDAEKYDSGNEPQVSLKMLITLKEYIEKYCQNGVPISNQKQQ